MALQIITDTSCDLPEAELEKYEIEMIPLKVTFANGETFLDRYEIDPPAFLKNMAASRTLPKTAAPDPDTFMRYFEQGLKSCGNVLFVSLSSGLSSTYQTALLACKMLNNEKVKVFDSLTASLGTGIMAIRARHMDRQGSNLSAIIENLTGIRATRQVIFTLDTLENVVKGGRLTRIEGLAGSLLNIKPILQGNSLGIPVVVEKLRGRKKAMHRLVDMLGEVVGPDIQERIIGVSHVNAYEDAQQLARCIIQKYNLVHKILIAEMSATIGTYAGEGGLMINA